MSVARPWNFGFSGRSRFGTASGCLDPERQRALFALLLLNRGETLSTDRLVDELWGDTPQPTAAKIVQNYVSQLRKSLGSDVVILTRGSGYQLSRDAGELDLDRFETQLEQGRAERARGDPAKAAETLRGALRLWRGAPLADFTFDSFAQAEIGRLEERRHVAEEERIEADLALGRHADLVGELEALSARDPLRERLRGQLMLALYRSGRQSEALRAPGLPGDAPPARGRARARAEPGAAAAREGDPDPGSLARGARSRASPSPAGRPSGDGSPPCRGRRDPCSLPPPPPRSSCYWRRTTTARSNPSLRAPSV